MATDPYIGTIMVFAGNLRPRAGRRAMAACCPSASTTPSLA